MKKIDCLIISTGRAASTAIYQYLNRGCDLNLPHNKEPHYWCDISKYMGLYDLLKNIHIKHENTYYELYSSSKKHIDASVGYFFCMAEVVDRLKTDNKKPKVVFLYRDPVSRARSLFNELHKKGLTQMKSVSEDIKLERSNGLWWERYYDNVPYMDVFNIIDSFFNEILLINYDLFSNDPERAIRTIANFIGVSVVSEIDYTPVNSSAEARFKRKYNFAIKFSGLLPTSIRNYIKNVIVDVMNEHSLPENDDIAHHLKYSIGQYKSFRELIRYEDILCMKK